MKKTDLVLKTKQVQTDTLRLAYGLTHLWLGFSVGNLDDDDIAIIGRVATAGVQLIMAGLYMNQLI